MTHDATDLVRQKIKARHRAAMEGLLKDAANMSKEELLKHKYTALACEACLADWDEALKDIRRARGDL